MATMSAAVNATNYDMIPTLVPKAKDLVAGPESEFVVFEKRGGGTSRPTAQRLDRGNVCRSGVDAA